MDLSVQDALVISSILFFFGFLSMIFIILQYKKSMYGLNIFAYYFLFNSIGTLGMYYSDTFPEFVSIVVANYLIVLASISLVIGILKFFNKKVQYKTFIGVSVFFIISISYFTFIESSIFARTFIFGTTVVSLHVLLLVLLLKEQKRTNNKVDLFSIFVIIYIVIMLVRAIQLLFQPVPEILFDSSLAAAVIIILLATSGTLIAVGVLSLISNKLINEVKEGETIFTNFINYAPTPAMVHAEDGEMLNISKAFTDITGYTKDDLKTVDDWINTAYTDKRDTVRTIISNLYKYKDKKNENVIEILTKDRKVRIWSFYSSYIGVLPDGRHSAMSVAVDITDTKARELQVLKLQKRNKKLIDANKIAVDLADLLVWRMNFEDKKDRNYIFVNDKYAEVMGWNPNENGMIAENEFLDSIYKDGLGNESYNKFLNFHRKIHNNELDEYVLYDFEHINATTSEKVFLEHHTKVEERFPNGEIKIIGGYVVDVTKTREIEEKLLFEKYKAQKYLDIIGNMLIALDRNGNITLINKKGCEILEVTEEEALGKNWFDNFIPKAIANEVKEVFANVFREDTEMATNYENVVISKTGKKIAINWYNSIFYDVNGHIKGVISSGEDITEKRKYEDNLREIGYRDALTGLFNRRYYEEKLKELDVESNYPITLAMGDINGLKLINDAFGHNAGDELLISAANVIKNTCRETDLIARIGGDEFVVAMPKTSEEAAELIISSIHEKLKSISIESIQLSISFGIQTKVDKLEDIQETYRSAEDLMYREKLLEIPSMRSGAIETILNTLYEKDKNSEIHSRTVSLISEKIAKASGMSRQDIAETKTAGLLHDIGKIIISLSIINKEGKLTTSEYKTMKTHSEIGFRILNSTSDMRSISNIVLCHHERWDGEGYPRGIKSDEIPVKARIITIADAYDAMTSERTYREIISKEDALKEIIANSGTQFDPELVKVFKENFKIITSV